MTLLRSIAATLLLVVLVAPVMACLVPDQALTPAERSCCRRMAGQCGGMQGSQSHSCCKISSRSAAPFLTSSRFVLTGRGSATLLFRPAVAAACATATFADCSLDVAHPPPGSPPATTVLRI